MIDKIIDKHVYQVIGAEEGITLQVLLCQRRAVSVASVADLIRGGSAYVDGQRVREPEHMLHAGQRVVLRTPMKSAAPLSEPVLAYLDRDVAVLEKPAGMPSQPVRQGGISSLMDFISEQLGREARLLHRLDQDASGLLLVSRHRRSRASLARQVQQHQLIRRYLALVQGVPPWTEICLVSRLAVRNKKVTSTVDPRGHQAETAVKVLQAARSCCLLQVELFTGRTHQVRVHLAETGFPLLGDDRYGGPAAPRLALHAHLLEFRACAGHMVQVHSPLPSVLFKMWSG